MSSGLWLEMRITVKAAVESTLLLNQDILEDEQSSSRALHESTVGFVAVYLPIHSRWPVYP